MKKIKIIIGAVMLTVVFSIILTSVKTTKAAIAKPTDKVYTCTLQPGGWVLCKGNSSESCLHCLR